MRPFRVVTQKNWLAEQFAPMGAIRDWGFDIDPVTAPETIWWAPGAWVASALKADVRLPLMSCGPRWLELLPTDWRGRLCSTRTVAQICDEDYSADSGEVFVKLPEAKLDVFPARTHILSRHFPTTIRQYQLPDDALIQVQNVVDFFVEARFWIAHKEIVAASYYRMDSEIWGGEDWDDLAAIMKPVMKTDMARLATEVARIMPAPPGYVLDCGVTRGGDVLVVEANAAWSSGPYDGDSAGIFEATKASHDFDGRYPEWAWNPNPALHKAGPLKVMTR